MSDLLKRKNKIFKINHLLLDGLIILAIIFSFMGFELLVQAQQSSPPPTSNQIEIFFENSHKNFVKCLREKYQQGNTIAGFTWTIIGFTLTNPPIPITGYDVQPIKNNCPSGNSIDNATMRKIVSCVDQIVFIDGVGWNQRNFSRVGDCMAVTKNTIGRYRQAYIDCLIRNKYNPETNYLDKGDKSLLDLCIQEKDRALVFPINIADDSSLPYLSRLIACLDHNQAKPKFQAHSALGSWDWERDGHLTWDGNIFGINIGSPNCRWFIEEFSQLKMRDPIRELGILPGGGDGSIDIPDLNFNPIIIEIPTEQTCWISKTGKNDGPNLQNIWNPGNWLPIMYKCQNTTPDGRPIPLHPINFIPIAIRLFAFITSLLIWLIILNLVIGIILFIVGVATSILAWVKKILIGSVAVVIVLISMYFILYFILSIFQG